MRFVLAMVLAGLALPLSVSAQVDDEGKAAESADTPQPARGVRRWHPEAFVDPKAPDNAKSDFEIEHVKPTPKQLAIEERPASARSVPGEVIVPGVGVMTTPQIEREIERLEKQRDDIKLAGPRAGVGITAILVPGGAMMIGAGAAFRSIETGLLCPPDDPSCGEPDAASKAMTAAGVAVLIGGIVGVILTSRKLKRSKEQRDRIDRKIRRFQRSLPAPSD
jgi:hypothetical protein